MKSVSFFSKATIISRIINVAFLLSFISTVCANSKSPPINLRKSADKTQICCKSKPDLCKEEKKNLKICGVLFGFVWDFVCYFLFVCLNEQTVQ